MTYATEHENIRTMIVQLGLRVTMSTSISLPTSNLCVLNTE